MKILSIMRNGNPRTIGGIETFNRNLKKMFPEEVIFFAKPLVKELSYFNVEDVIEYKEHNFFIKKIFKKKFLLRMALKKLKTDIYILNTVGDFKVISDKNKKYIFVQHMNFEEWIGRKSKKEINKNIEKLDYFVFLSEFDKKRFLKELNFPEEKAVVIRHTSELELLSEKKIKNKNLIMICRLDNRQKRLDLAIKAMRKLKDFTLNIYGSGQDREYLENIIKENNLKNVILHGGTNQIKEKLDENSIFIMTSDYEGYGITNIEAMRKGLPIILRNTFDAAPDIVQNNGILLNKEWNEDKFIEAVSEVYNNYDYYSENSLKMGKRHNFEVIKKEWEKLFKSLK